MPLDASWMGHSICHNEQIQEETGRSCNPVIRSQSYHMCFAFQILSFAILSYSYIPPAEGLHRVVGDGSGMPRLMNIEWAVMAPFSCKLRG